MQISRPDLSLLSADVRAYIEALEAELIRLRPRKRVKKERPEVTPLVEIEPNEPPTTMGLITLNSAGVAKRTLRHLYNRQHRGGRGIFDLDTPENQPPSTLVIVDESEELLLISNFARAYRLPATRLQETSIHSRGRPLDKFLIFDRGERISLILPWPTRGSLVVATKTGQVRRFRHYAFRQNMPQGMLLFSITESGQPAAACLTPGDSEIFIATTDGRGIRFPEKVIPASGCRGIRLQKKDGIAGITAIDEESGVFLLGADGKGTIRLMSGFKANKAPGAQGKVAMKTNQLVGAVTVDDKDELFIISKLSKVIRFSALEIPAKEGIVQGVSCMTLRGDEAVAVTVGRVV
jgi:DNA gyrase subunit A